MDVAAKYGGRIKEILAREGDLVEEGQVLVKMDTSELEAELEKDKAKLAESQEAAAEVKTEITKDESQLKLADVEFKRTKSLFDAKPSPGRSTTGTGPRLETAKASLDGSKAKLNTANQSINAAAARSEANGGEDRRCHPQIAGQGASTLPAWPSRPRSFPSAGRS